MSGAKNCPETPRQKMIGMMYLVLTAMLALNVSSDILEGFSKVDDSLHSTIISADMRTQELYKDFDALYNQNKDKTKEWLEKALEVKKESDELFNYIENFKYEILKIADGKDADPEAINIKARENLDAAGEYALVKKDESGTFNGLVLKKKIDDYRKMLIGYNENKTDAYNAIFSTEPTRKPGQEQKPWETSMFEMMPVIAVVTILTKYQSDIRSAEADVVNFLKSQTDAGDFRVNKIQAYALPTSSSYVIKGGKYSAQIVLSAIDSTLTPDYEVNGRELGNEKGIYEVMCNTPGNFDYSGFIKVRRGDNVFEYPFKQSYTVGEPTATISNSDLNVVYRGIDNKFSISVPGVPSENISVTVDGGTANKSGAGMYNIRANRDGEIKISVSATIEGKSMPMGSSIFRVKYLPDPKSFLQYTDAGGVVRQIQDGSLTKRLLKNNPSIVASYGPDELVKANFNVTSFTMTTVMGSTNSSAPSLSTRQLSDIDRLEGGDNITFKNIKAVGPDGKTRNLPPVTVQL